MKHKCIPILLVFYFFLTQILICQTIEKTYDKFKILQKSGQLTTIEDGKMTDSSIVSVTGPGLKKEILFRDMRILERKVGTKALQYALYGAGIGLLGCIGAAAQIEADPNVELKPNWVTLSLIITGVSAGIGALIGSATDKWEQVPLNTLIKPNTALNTISFSFSIRL